METLLSNHTEKRVEVTGLFVYPVKSCRGIALQEAELGPSGFLHDREFLVVDESDNFLTQRTAPELATVQISLGPRGLVLSTSSAGELELPFGAFKPELAGSRDTRRVTIFHDQVLADDAGAAAAAWFSDILHRACRLVRVGASYSRQVPLARIAAAHRPAKAPEISFTDGFPTLLVSEESLADLNLRLAEPIPMNRFRPNIVVRGCVPYEENTWGMLRADAVIFGCATTCLRCVITSIDQTTGESTGAEPLRTLSTYRRSPDRAGVIFGQYLIHWGNGKLRLGDWLTPGD